MGLKWLDQPVMLHSSRMDHCMLTDEQCQYRNGYWRYWYQADHRYALPTVYLCLAFIGFFAITNLVASLANRSRPKSPLWRRVVAVSRYATYKRYRLSVLNWNSPPLGVLLMGAVGIIYFFSMTLGPKPYYWPNTAEVRYGGSPPIATRSGWMAIACLPFILLLAAKANMITAVTGVSYEKLNVFHRWLSYAMFVLALIHTFPFIVVHIQAGDMVEEWNGSIFYWAGVAALIPQAWLTIMSYGPIRDRFYEIFKATHYLASFLFIFFLFLHCDFTLTSADYFIAAGSLYIASLLFSTIRTHVAYGRSHRAQLSLLPGGTIQAIIPIRPIDVVHSPIPVGFNWKPTQHVFVHLHGVFKGKSNWSSRLGAWSAHPFTICSLPPHVKEEDEDSVEIPKVRLLITPPQRRKGGMTHHLTNHLRHAIENSYDGTANSKRSSVSVPVSLDGPYGGLPVKSFVNFDEVLIVAGGSGAGFTLPVLEDIFRQVESEYLLPPRVHIVLTTRYAEVKEWYVKEIETLAKSYPTVTQRDWLNVHLHVTGSAQLVSEKVPSESPADEKSAFATPVQTPAMDLLDATHQLIDVTPSSAPSQPRSCCLPAVDSDDEIQIETPPEVQQQSSCCSSKAKTAAPEPVPVAEPAKSSCCSSKAKPAAAATPEPVKASSCCSSTAIAPAPTTAATTNLRKSCCKKSPPVETLNLFTSVGRPSLPSIVADVASKPGAAVGIAVCGPASLQYDVCNAAARAQLSIISGNDNGAREVYLHSESFSW